MSWAWTMAGGWLLPGVLVGGFLLLLATALALWAGEPVRRQRLADYGVVAALLAVALSFGPRWLSLSFAPAESPAPAPVATPMPDAPAPPLQPEQPADTGGWVELPPAPAVEAPAAPAAPSPAPEPPALAVTEPPAAPPAGVAWPDLLPSLLGWLGAAHAAGAAVLLARWALGHVGLWRLLRAAEPVPAEVAAVCRSLCGDRAPPRLLQSRRLRVPLSCGLFRPTILLPTSLCDRPDAAPLRWILAHELTHLRRRDAWSCLLFGAGEVVFYALPWFWWLRRQARLCREYVADAAAAAQGGAAEDYAQFLLNLSAAPAAPAGALGVTGHTSDLFRRVAMLLRSSAVVEKRPPRLWSLGVAAGLLSLAALVAGVGLRAEVARADEPQKGQTKKDEPKKEEPKKDDGKKEAPKKEADQELEIDNLIKNLPPGFDAEQVKAMRERMRRAMEQMRQQPPGVPFPGGAGGAFGGFGAAGQFNPFGRPADGRLGVRVQQPSEALVDQLDLPKGQGVVIEDVTPDSAAAKAGLKANDILLELNGKPVSSNVIEVVKMINGLKAKTPVDAVVMRKGKKETVKGISLPEVKDERPAFGGFGGAAGAFGGVAPVPAFPAPPVFGGAGGGFGGGLGVVGANNGVMTTVFRSGDHFTARHQEGNLVITVTGNVADGKATTKTINVQDGATHEKYESVDKVPEQYRDKVKNLVEMGEKGAAKVEIK